MIGTDDGISGRPVPSPLETATPHMRRRRLGVTAVVATLAAAGILAAAAAVNRPLVSDGVLVSAAPAARSGDPSAMAVWSSFPVDRQPRPVVVLQPDVADPASGFGDGDDKEAYLDHHSRLATALPPTPPHAGPYKVRPASAAVAKLTGGVESTDHGALVITAVTLTEHTFSTDRGDIALPAWAIRFDDVQDPAYVLAVAAADLFAHTDDPASWNGADGNHITVALTPRHESTGPCDGGYTQTVQVTESPTTVELVRTTTPIPIPPQSGTDIACPAVAYGTVDPPLVPGTPGTRTIDLGRALGNRPVVNADGIPWKVAAT